MSTIQGRLPLNSPEKGCVLLAIMTSFPASQELSSSLFCPDLDLLVCEVHGYTLHFQVGVAIDSRKVYGVAGEATIQGRRLLQPRRLVRRLLFEGGYYSRVASDRGYTVFQLPQ